MKRARVAVNFLRSYWRMILSANRPPLFGIMR
jgi:hypothetical protein